MLRHKLFGSKQQQAPRTLSLEQLKTLYESLQKVDWSKSKNVDVIIESLRSLAELLIWGDQNDPTVFDYFLEKQMLSYFVQIIQKCSPETTHAASPSDGAAHAQETISVSNSTVNSSSAKPAATTPHSVESLAYSSTTLTQQAKNYVCVQVLQLLNILFENIVHETSIYYLLSNNHVNNIIESTYDFNDDEVLAQYISMLKSLSLKLNAHTVHFFFNEQTRGFAILRQSLKFFSHQETMVRIASRTICLNVLRVDEERARQFILDYHSEFVFSRIVHEVRHHLLLKVDKIVRQFHSSESINLSSPARARDRLVSLHEDHADHLGFLNEVFELNVSSFNNILRLHLLNKLFIPVHCTSLFEYMGTRTVPDDDDSLLHPVSALYSLGLCYSAIQNTEFLEQLTCFMLSSSSALAINGQSFFGALMDTIRLPSAVIASGGSASTTDVNAQREQHASPPTAASAATLLLVMPVLCMLYSMNRSSTFCACPAYQDSLGSNMASRTLLIQLISALCQTGVRLAIVCLHLAVAVVEKMILPQKLVVVSSNSLLPTNALCDTFIPNTVVINTESSNDAGNDNLAENDNLNTTPVQQHSGLADDLIACLEDVREHSLLTLRRFYQPTNGFVLAYEAQLDAARTYKCNLKRIWLHCLSNATYFPQQQQQSAHNRQVQRTVAAVQDDVVLDILCDTGEHNSEVGALRSFLLLSRLCSIAEAESNVDDDDNERRNWFEQLQLFSSFDADMTVADKTSELLLVRDDLLDVTKCELLSCAYYESWDATATATASSKSSTQSAGGAEIVAAANNSDARLRFLVVHARQLVLVEPASKAGFAAVREVFPLHLCLISNDKNERTRSALLLKVFSLHPNVASGDYERFLGSGGTTAINTPDASQSAARDSSSSPRRPATPVSQLKILIDGRLKFDDHIRCLAAAHKLKDRKVKLLATSLQRLADILDLPPAMRPTPSSSTSSIGSNVVKLPLAKTTDVRQRAELAASKLTSKSTGGMAPTEVVTSSSQRSMFLEKLWSTPSRRRKPPGGLARLTPADSDNRDAAVMNAAAAPPGANIAMVYMQPTNSVAANMNEQCLINISSSDSENLPTVSVGDELYTNTTASQDISRAFETESSMQSSEVSQETTLTSSAAILTADTVDPSQPSAAEKNAVVEPQENKAQQFQVNSSSSSSAHSSPDTRSSSMHGGGNDASEDGSKPPAIPKRTRRTHKPGTVHHI